MNNFATKSERKFPFLSQSLSLKQHLDFLKIHKVYIKALSINALFGLEGPDLGNVILRNRVGLRGQSSFPCSGKTDHPVCHFSFICHSFWTILEANISRLLRIWRLRIVDAVWQNCQDPNSGDRHVPRVQFLLKLNARYICT